MDPNSNSPADTNSNPVLPTDPLAVVTPSFPPTDTTTQAQDTQPVVGVDTGLNNNIPPINNVMPMASDPSVPAPSFEPTPFVDNQLPESNLSSTDTGASVEQSSPIATPSTDNSAINWTTPAVEQPVIGPSISSAPSVTEVAPVPLTSPSADAPVSLFDTSATQPMVPAAADISVPTPPADPMTPWSAPITDMSSPAPEVTPPAENLAGSTSDPMANWSASAASVEPIPTDSIPTDLSHLAADTSGNMSMPNPVFSNEALVIPPFSAETAPTANTTSKGFPKWLLIIAGVILLLVIGASAYFILGVGKFGQPATVSVPAEQPQLATPPEQIIPTESPTVDNATPPAGFDTLNGTEATTATSETTTSAKPLSTMDLLKQRKALTPTPAPAL